MQVGEEKEERWYCMGCYLPPSDKEGDAQQLLSHAMQGQPSGTRLLVLDKLKADLDVPQTTQEDVLAAEVAEHGVVCATRQFVGRQTRHMRGSWTFLRSSYTKEGEQRWIWGKPDYVLAQEKDRRRLRSCRWLLVLHHDSDDHTLVLRIEADPKGSNATSRGRQHCPRQTPPGQ